MHVFHQDMLTEIRLKCSMYAWNHPIKRSANVAFRDIFDPYCAEYKEHDDAGRAKVLQQMLKDGIINNVLVFYKMFMDMFAEDRPDIANAAPDALALMVQYLLVVPSETLCQKELRQNGE